MSKISICIPTTELKYSNGDTMGVYMLNHLLNSIQSQTFKDYEVIISDQSESDIIEKECDNWKNLNLKYFRNDKGRGSAANNLNFAISKSSGSYIKTIFQDDFFHNPKTLEYIVENLNDNSWGAVGTYHCYENEVDKIVNPLSPYWTDEVSLLSGINTISGPSVIFFKNDNNFFDENLCWLNDVEFYYRLYLKYGLPLLLPEKMILQRLRKEGVSNNLSASIQFEEKDYVLAKHSITNASKNIEDYPSIYNRIKNL